MVAAMPCKMGTRNRFTEPQQTAASRITESNKKDKSCMHWIHEKACGIYQEVMKITSLKKGSIQKAATTKSINLFRCPMRWKLLTPKPQWAKNGKSSKSCQRGKWTRWREHRGKKKIHYVSLMDTCHLKNAELKPKHQKYKGWVVLRSDMVKDDSSPYTVFTEHRSSASQVTAAKVMDIISRLPDCAGQAADAISAYTQVKMEDAPTLLKIPESECPDIWIRLPMHKWQNSWYSMEDPVVPLERNLYGHFLAGPLWERQFEKVFFFTVGKKFQIGTACSLTEEKDYSCLCTWTISNWQARQKT